MWRGFAQESALGLALVAQLELIGGMSQWAVYVATHLPDPAQREDTVRSLLRRHAPEWAAHPAAHDFLLERLAVPAPLLAETMAEWSMFCEDPEGSTHPSILPFLTYPCMLFYSIAYHLIFLESNVRMCTKHLLMQAGQCQLLMEANQWNAAHQVWGDNMALNSLVHAGTTAGPMAGCAAAFEAHSADIDAAEGSIKSWRFFQSLSVLQVFVPLRPLLSSSC